MPTLICSIFGHNMDVIKVTKFDQNQYAPQGDTSDKYLHWIHLLLKCRRCGATKDDQINTWEQNRF